MGIVGLYSPQYGDIQEVDESLVDRYIAGGWLPVGGGGGGGGVTDTAVAQQLGSGAQSRAVLDAGYTAILPVVATVTSSVTAALNTSIPADATSGPVTITLPSPTRVGQRIRVEKVDATANAVTVALTLKGASTTISMPFTAEIRTFVAESLTSWRTDSGNTPKSALDATYVQTAVAGPIALRARRLLAGARPGAQYALSPLAPTVTLTQNTSTSSFTGAARVQPKMLDAVAFDLAGDPHFDTVGIPQGRLNLAFGDIARPDVLTGGASQSARFAPRWRFLHTGAAFEVFTRFASGTFRYRLHFDGLPLTADLVTTSVTAGQRATLKVDFGATATRLVEVEIDDPSFGGIFIPATDSVTRPRTPRLLLAGSGDSHTGGANGVGRNDTWVRRTAAALGCDWTNLGIGGSGYLNDNGTTGANFRNRITPDLVASVPEVVVYEGSWNDSAKTAAELSTEALYCFQTIRAALPNAVLIAAGPYVTSHSLNVRLDEFDAALRAAAQTAGWQGYISYRDPANLKATAPAWVASTAYILGQVVVYNGFAQECQAAHTSGASWDQTKWRSTAIVTGTGKVGTTTGDGSADVQVSSDGVHATALGHEIKAGHVSTEVQRICRGIASGLTWAA